jgi:hypothetical protein
MSRVRITAAADFGRVAVLMGGRLEPSARFRC